MAKIVEAGFQPGPVVACVGCFVVVEVAVIHADGEQGITLKIDGLPVVDPHYAHLADQHVRKTFTPWLSHTRTMRQGLLCRKGRVWWGRI